MPSKKKRSPTTTNATNVRAAPKRVGARPTASASSAAKFTVPGLTASDGDATAGVLQERLIALIDLQLTLKHIHWNVVGPDFIGVHLMLDPQVDGVRAMVDATAERIAALGSSPNGLVGHVAHVRGWNDYSFGRALVPEHLGALDIVYSGVVESHRAAIEHLEHRDAVSQDMIVGQTGVLEQYQWFVRAHLESAAGRLSTAGTRSEHDAAGKARTAAFAR